MKTLYILFLGLLVSGGVMAQPCMPNGITFTTQEQVDNFQINYPNCTEILGNVHIGVYLGCDINNLSGLNVLTSIGGSLFIDFTDILENLKGLNNLDSIGGGLVVWYNDSLSELTGLENVTSIGGLNFGPNPLLTSLTGLDSLSFLGGELLINNSSLYSLEGLENLEVIDGGLNLWGNYFLNDLSGLENITSFQGSLTIAFNKSLTNLIGLEGLEVINALYGTQALSITNNDSLINLSGLEGITNIDGDVSVTANPNLTSLTAIGNIEDGSIEILNVNNNPLLQTCEVQIICEHLALNGIAYIENNAAGCNSPEEVEDACESVSINEINDLQDLNIYPNPTYASITIELPTQPSKNTSLTIYNLNGQQLITQPITEPQTVVDVSGLPKGVYFVKIMDDEKVMMGKVIKQ